MSQCLRQRLPGLARIDHLVDDAGVAGPLQAARHLLMFRRQLCLDLVPMFLGNLGKLPPTGAVVVVSPMKLVGGTGSPVRVLALVPRP